MKRDVINCKRKIFGSCGHLYYINTRSCVSSAGLNVGTRTLSLKGVFSLRTFHWVSFEGITMMSHASLGIFSTFSLNLFSWIFSKKKKQEKIQFCLFSFRNPYVIVGMGSFLWRNHGDIDFFSNYLMSRQKKLHVEIDLRYRKNGFKNLISPASSTKIQTLLTWNIVIWILDIN